MSLTGVRYALKIATPGGSSAQLQIKVGFAPSGGRCLAYPRIVTALSQQVMHCAAQPVECTAILT